MHDLVRPAAAPPLEDDVEVLYRRLAPQVQAIVARNVGAPETVIEEACQVAWGRLHDHRDRVAATAVLGWLCTTATREVLHGLRSRRREVSLDDPRQQAAVIEIASRAAGPERVAELREQLAEVRELPVRQRQMIWLQGLGYEYREIAQQTGATRRTVERQLLRAKRRLATAGENRAE